MNPVPKIVYAAAVVVLAMVWASVFGIGFGLTVAAIAPEFFTDHHPTAVIRDNPTAMAVMWGIIDPTPFGFGIGCIWAATATLGRAPVLPFRRIVLTTLGGLIAFMIGAYLTLGIAYVCIDLLQLSNPNESNELRASIVAFRWAWVPGVVIGIFAAISIWRTRKKLDPTIPA